MADNPADGDEDGGKKHAEEQFDGAGTVSILLRVVCWSIVGVS